MDQTVTTATTETSSVYGWADQGEGKYLLRTTMVLRNVQPGFQEVVSVRTSEAKVTDADYAYGVEFADEVAAEDYLAGLGA